MKPHTQKGHKDFVFRLTMQNLADELEDQGIHFLFHRGADERGRLTGLRRYRGQDSLEEKYAYLCRRGELPEELAPGKRANLIVMGQVPALFLRGASSILEISSEEDFSRIEEICLKTFEKTREWSDRLREICISSGSIDAMCMVSYEYFHNPLFVHDAHFYCVSCPVSRREMVQWEIEPHSGYTILPMEYINEFKTNREYLETLKTRGARVYPGSLRGYRDIYVNFWDNHGKYNGRLVICELDSPLKPGQLAAAEYLADMIQQCLKRPGYENHTYNEMLDEAILKLLRGETVERGKMEKLVRLLGWGEENEYVCVCVDMDPGESEFVNATSLCSEAEARIAGSKALWLRRQMFLLINVAMNENYTSDLAYILREGLYRAGISHRFADLSRLRDYYLQAGAALRSCRRRQSHIWSRYFEETALDYLIESAGKVMDPVMFCSEKLMRLREMDRREGTDYYQVMRAYIENERNTVKTAKELYMGRSTLFYRLKKIRELTHMDPEKLEDPWLNLYLRLSLYILEHAEGQDPA